MFHIILLNPEIPGNAGNVIRLVANCGARLHLAGELGFEMSDSRLRRAGLDYREYADVQIHDSLSAAFVAAENSDKNIAENIFANVAENNNEHSSANVAGNSENGNKSGRRFAVSVCGETRFDSPQFRAGDIFVFGRESDGLPREVLDSFAPANRLHIPMRPQNRSINLSNAVAIVLMEAWRQNGFCGAGSVLRK